MNKKNFMKHPIWDYASAIVWTLIIIAEIKNYLFHDPSRIISYVIIFMSLSVIILNIRSIVKRTKSKRKYEKTKKRIFGNDKPKKNFWYKLNKFFTIATPAIDDEVDEMLDTKEGRKIIFDMIDSDKEKRKKI